MNNMHFLKRLEKLGEVNADTTLEQIQFKIRALKEIPISDSLGELKKRAMIEKSASLQLLNIMLEIKEGVVEKRLKLRYAQRSINQELKRLGVGQVNFQSTETSVH